MNITDRIYFSALSKGAKAYVSGLLVSRLNGAQIFVFSRRLERNGQFVGAAIVSFDGKLLSETWEAVALGPNSTVGIIRTDGQLVARFPSPDGPLDMSKYELFTEHLPRAASGTYLAISPADGERRVVAYQTVDGTEFIAVGSTDYSVGMTSFWGNVFIACAVVGSQRLDPLRLGDGSGTCSKDAA